ncbi:MAG TPA: glucose-1-phosphate cytidylyltransferase [Dongiaceae bacterium]|nr:glucose-1-phosphate cytidylyltransferase [Dongiaceae bacterium]
MKAVILAGGMGTRISEESRLRPKPMIEIGGMPILWHIMKIFSAGGVNDFVICCGYLGYVIKSYFANYLLHVSDVTFDLAQNRMQIHQNGAESWKVTLVDTGVTTMTGGRMKRVARYLGDEEFFLTYGDGVADIDVRSLLAFHRKHGLLATVTSVRPPSRFGALVTDGERVVSFQEKQQGNSWINGGFFVLSPRTLDYVEGDATVWEGEPLERLAREGQLASFYHEGFWHPMDTLRDKNQLESLWNAGHAPWKLWK